MPDTTDQIASLEARMEQVRIERDAANDQFRRQLRALRGEIKVLRAEALLAEAHAEVDAQGIDAETVSTPQED